MEDWRINCSSYVPCGQYRKTFNENGQPTDSETTNKRAAVFVDELMYWIAAKIN